jgi:hypothetical protein
LAWSYWAARIAAWHPFALAACSAGQAIGNGVGGAISFGVG